MRTVTPPDVKWLINEAAALAGELERIDREISDLAARRERELATLARQREKVRRARDACLATLELSTTPMATEVSLPVVHAHRPYDRRGGLLAFLRDAITQAAPAAVNTELLARMAIEHMGLQILSPKEYSRFKHNTIGRALRKFEQDGFVERILTRSAGVSRFSVWRLKPDIPTLVELKGRAGAADGDKMEVKGG
ncbi:hypothetical protein [Noviherbaspirillum autotrophicum]|nr:hypothetical protein [Noviherbaspirillum autotrophicum]